MTLHTPFMITPRLLPGLQIGGAYVSLEHVGYSHDGRDIYRWYVDLPDGSEHSAADLKSGCQGAGYQEMFGTLLCFLGACGEALDYQTRTGRESENADLFPAPVAEWASQHSDEISMLQCEIEESGAELIVD